jgi:hypothetical protein
VELQRIIDGFLMVKAEALAAASEPGEELP